MGWSDRYIGWAAAVCLAAGCAAPQKAPEPVKPAQARVARIFPQPASLEEAKVVVTVEVYNPRSEAIGLTGIDYTILADDIGAKVEGRSTTNGQLEPEQGAEVEFTEAFPFPKDSEAYLAVLERGTIPIDVKGEVTFADGSKAAFSRKGAIAAPALPKFIVHDAQAARYDGGKGIDVTLFLRLVNENSFTVVVDEIRYEVNVNDKKIKAGKDIGVRLVANAVSEYEESAAVDEQNFGRKGVRAVLADGKVQYHVTGAVDIRGMELPVDLRGEVALVGSTE